MPIDTLKTCLQVYGSNGTSILLNKFQQEGISCFYSGSIAASAATFLGHYPWFLTYNALSSLLPTSAELHNLAAADSDVGVSSLILAVASLDDQLISLLRSAFIGLCASSASDITSNSLRVLKTSKQTNGMMKSSSSSGEEDQQSYVSIAKKIIEENGVLGLLTRGLQVGFTLCCSNILPSLKARACVVDEAVGKRVARDVILCTIQIFQRRQALGRYM